MFFVARNTRRAELRRTAAWERLCDAFEHDTIREQFDEPDDILTDRFATAFGQLSDLDRQLFIGSVWGGLTFAKLAEQHHLTPNAVHHRITRARKKFRESLVKLGPIGGSSGH